MEHLKSTTVTIDGQNTENCNLLNENDYITMKSMNAIKAGQCYTFPVKEIRKEYARSLYIVEVEGSECAVTQYPCQSNDPKPERLSCLVQDIRDGVPQLVQDIEPLLARYYEIGEDYPFTVINDRTDQPNGHYIVADSYGFQFWLFTKQRLRIRQAITCKVIDRQANHLKLELQENEETTQGLRHYKWSELAPFVITPEKRSLQ